MPTSMISSTQSTSDSSSRHQRNLAEKQRRDKLNGYITELANIVPMVSMSTKRLDKTSILRLSAAHLRLHKNPLQNHLKQSTKKLSWRPGYFSGQHLNELLGAVDGFILVASSLGKILYVSQAVEYFLAHQHIDMIGHSLFSFIHPSDVDYVRKYIYSLSKTLVEVKGETPYVRCSFYCRMKEHCQPRSEVVTYQPTHIIGRLSLTEHSLLAQKSENKEKESLGNFILKVFVRLIQSGLYSELFLVDSVQDEYITRHKFDGTIIFADHRISTITGHLPYEVCGLSAYQYIFHDDIPVAAFAHKLMFSSANGTGVIVYRLKTSNNEAVYLKSRGHLQYDKTTLQVDHFVCCNKLLNEEEGQAELRAFVERFTPHITNDTTNMLLESLCFGHNFSMKSTGGFPSLPSASKKSVNNSISIQEVNSSSSSDSISCSFQAYSNPTVHNGHDHLQRKQIAESHFIQPSTSLDPQPTGTSKEIGNNIPPGSDEFLCADTMIQHSRSENGHNEQLYNYHTNDDVITYEQLQATNEKCASPNKSSKNDLTEVIAINGFHRYNVANDICEYSGNNGSLQLYQPSYADQSNGKNGICSVPELESSEISFSYISDLFSGSNMVLSDSFSQTNNEDITQLQSSSGNALYNCDTIINFPFNFTSLQENCEIFNGDNQLHIEKFCGDAAGTFKVPLNSASKTWKPGKG